MLARAIGVVAAFTAAFSVSFLSESSWAAILVAAVAAAAGGLARSRALLVATPVAGAVAYVLALGLFGQLGSVPDDSVEGYGQILVNTAAILLGLAVVTFIFHLAGVTYRRQRAA